MCRFLFLTVLSWNSLDRGVRKTSQRYVLGTYKSTTPQHDTIINYILENNKSGADTLKSYLLENERTCKCFDGKVRAVGEGE